MTRNEAIKIGEAILQWCISEYGYSKYRKECPLLEVEYKSGWRDYGEYQSEENCISIYTEHCRSTIIIKTIIHEYWHYLQSPSWLSRNRRIYVYNKNPYEIESMEREKDWKRCFEYLKKKKEI